MPAETADKPCSAASAPARWAASTAGSGSNRNWSSCRRTDIGSFGWPTTLRSCTAVVRQHGGAALGPALGQRAVPGDELPALRGRG